MICQHVETQYASYDRLYSLEARGNVPYLVLSSIEFLCRVCEKSASLDLSLVPVHEIHIKCDVCDRSLFSVSENEFEYLLEIAETDTFLNRGAKYYMTNSETETLRTVLQEEGYGIF